MMLPVAIGVFVVAAVFGLVNLIAILQNKPTPKVSVFLHGGIAAVGLLMVVVYVMKHTPSLLGSLTAFVVAAIGGFILFGIDMAKKPVPKWLAIIHPLIAATGLIMLIAFVMMPH
jgi:hypothetical protein